mgnify:CR=1 FL=1
MMEYWNDDLQKMTFHDLIPVKRSFTIPQLSVFPEHNISIVSEASEFEKM